MVPRLITFLRTAVCLKGKGGCSETWEDVERRDAIENRWTYTLLGSRTPPLSTFFPSIVIVIVPSAHSNVRA